MSKNNTRPNNPRNGKHHAWILEEIPKIKIASPIIKSATIYVGEFDEDKIDLAQLINDLQNFEPDDRISLILNSPGGLISEGRAMINAILHTGADIQTEIVSGAASMAAIMFCIGDRRIIYENSSIMFHNFSGGTVGKGQDMKDYIDHVTKNIELFFRSHLIGFTSKEIKKFMSGKEYWFGAKEMCERGIATHVNINGIMIPVEKYLKALKKAKKIAKKKNLDISSISEASLMGIDVMSPIIKERNQVIGNVSDTLSELVSQNDFLYN